MQALAQAFPTSRHSRIATPLGGTSVAFLLRKAVRNQATVLQGVQETLSAALFLHLHKGKAVTISEGAFPQHRTSLTRTCLLPSRKVAEVSHLQALAEEAHAACCFPLGV